MSIRNLSDADLRALVRYGTERFSAEAQRELDARKARLEQEKQRPVEAQVAAEFPNGRWS